MTYQQVPRPMLRIVKASKRAKVNEEIMWDVKFKLGRIANALEAAKSQIISKPNMILDEHMTIFYTEHFIYIVAIY